MEPILYILMRNDMTSMNPGKAMAQASHASNQFVATLPRDARDIYNEWLQCEGFGTVLARSLDLVSGVVHDPTYPIQDGTATHYVPVDTCAYIFGNKDDCVPVVQNFNLHP